MKRRTIGQPITLIRGGRKQITYAPSAATALERVGWVRVVETATPVPVERKPIADPKPDPIPG